MSWARHSQQTRAHSNHSGHVARFPRAARLLPYGPICVAKSERGKGLARALFEELRSRLPGRPAMLFVRADNPSSLQAHRKMGMRELGTFDNEGVRYMALTYSG